MARRPEVELNNSLIVSQGDQGVCIIVVGSLKLLETYIPFMYLYRTIRLRNDPHASKLRERIPCVASSRVVYLG